jgi:glutathione S-transferase
MKMRLYTHPLSANAHKVKLLLGYLGLSYEETNVDIPGGEQRRPEFLAISALGQIPVLDDGALRLRDAQAILVYAAGAFDSARTWWPEDAAGQGAISQWLAFAALELQNGINLSRLHFRLGAPCDLTAAQLQGEKTLAFVEQHLETRRWLELDRPTIADCACAPFLGRASEGGHDLAAYPRVVGWLQRMKALPGFCGMEGFE